MDRHPVEARKHVDGTGNGYSLSGESLEDIHPDLQEWQDAWNEKYGE
jgi:hypothetical protein